MKTSTTLVLVLFLALFFGGCSSESGKFGFGTSDCTQYFKNCLEQCNRSGKTKAECSESCEKARGMCRGMKIKGCMQKCNEQYGKGTNEAETCKASCQNIN